ncbi:MAG: efflux RND transporter periplasmic adaptor subunit [Flavobacteriales bacterium]|nr:efflux RND transporter periplasmic adaptor subunit [Flavobacteriales bacterium]
MLATLSSCSDEKKGIHPEQQPISHSIYASVTVKPAHLYTVYPQAAGIISNIFISEGDTVFSGEKIGSISNSNMEVNKEKALVQYQLAESKLYGTSNTLKSIETEISTLIAQVRFDSINYYKNLKLYDQDALAGTALDNSKLKYELSQKQLQNATQKYSQVKDELKSNLKLSEANLKVADINLDDSYMYSLIDGMVYSVQKEIGEFISSQMPFALIGSRDQFVLEMLVDEEDITQIKLGQQVIVSLEAYPDTTFRCEVTKILPQKDPINQTFTVEAIFLEKPNTLLLGMSGESNIIIQELESAIVIPRDYLSENKEVMTKDGLKKVKTGLMNLEFVQILEGLDENTLIFPLNEN